MFYMKYVVMWNMSI